MRLKKEAEKFAESSIFEGIVSVRALIYAAENGISSRKIRRLLFDKTKTESKAGEMGWLRKMSEKHGFTIEPADTDEIDSITVGNCHGGLVAYCGDRKFETLSASCLRNKSGKGFWVMLEGIEDPYNFGYALRSLYAAGIDGAILSPRNWMTAAGVVCRASAGASEMLPMYISEGTGAAGIFRAEGYKIVCADLRDSQPVYDTDLRYPVFLIVGGEKRGISRVLLDKADLRVRLDYGRHFNASLSAASAASIIGYEIFRQNRPDK